jgi:hypothetical protein
MTTKEYAKEHGFVQLTNTYHLPKEKQMMDIVLEDARKNNKQTCLVQTEQGAEVWQKLNPPKSVENK